MKSLLIIVLLLPLFLQGQEIPQDIPEEKEGEEAEMISVMPGEFVYNPEGRRDPFWNLLQGKSVKENREAIEGIAGLMIDELELEGIVFAQGAFKALLKGPDTRPYVVGIGDRVYDGEVVAMDRNSVSFKKSLTVALAGQKDRIIIKTLNPEQEEMNEKSDQYNFVDRNILASQPGARSQGGHQQNRIFPRRGFRATAHADRQDTAHS
jgi:Tfp pilus assembly protein PilP